MKQNTEELVAGVLQPLTHESKIDGMFEEVGLGEEEGEEVVEEVEVGEKRARQVMDTKPSSPSVGELELPTPP